MIEEKEYKNLYCRLYSRILSGYSPVNNAKKHVMSKFIESLPQTLIF